MALVEAKKEDFQRYKNFVDQIDNELKKHSPSITTPLKEPNRPKQPIKEKEVNLKLHLKAEMIRVQVPEKFKPITATAVDKVLRTKAAEPIKIDKNALKAPEAKIEVKLDQPIKESTPPVRTEFTKMVEAKPTPKTQAEYKQPLPVKIKALEKAMAERQATKAAPLKPEDRKNWFTPANEKTRPMTDAIDKAIKQHKTTQPQPERRPTTQKQETFSKAQEHPQKTATYETARERVKIEAENKRSRVPPEYRAKPYEEKTEAPKPKNKMAEPPKTEPQNKFSNAASEPANKPETTMPKMSNAFNTKSGAENAEQGKPRQSAESEPEVEI